MARSGKPRVVFTHCVNLQDEETFNLLHEMVNEEQHHSISSFVRSLIHAHHAARKAPGEVRA